MGARFASKDGAIICEYEYHLRSPQGAHSRHLSLNYCAGFVHIAFKHTGWPLIRGAESVEFNRKNVMSVIYKIEGDVGIRESALSHSTSEPEQKVLGVRFNYELGRK